ncbi:PAAR domain-containing protein [Burkholderia cenocepacia]|uniref:PAAR domain-containing protein n=1 Tax=Burkholderia cenocepacia TaxID=95486 RepID=UPI003D66FB48
MSDCCANACVIILHLLRKQVRSMKRYLLKVGDKSTTGGIVIEGVDSCTHHGTALTFVGAQVVCNACQSTGVIAAQGHLPHMEVCRTSRALALQRC